MFEQGLPGNTKAVLAILEKSEIIQKAYLAGGTALALQLGHRISYDLDFFTKAEFDEQILLPDAIKLYDKKYENLATAEIHIMKSLVYFEDAEADEMPKMLKKIDWEDVKRYFEYAVRRMLK